MVLISPLQATGVGRSARAREPDPRPGGGITPDRKSVDGGAFAAAGLGGRLPSDSDRGTPARNRLEDRPCRTGVPLRTVFTVRRGQEKLGNHAVMEPYARPPLNISMRPGVTMCPPALITRRPEDRGISAATREIFPPVIATSRTAERFSEGSITWPPFIRVS